MQALFCSITVTLLGPVLSSIHMILNTGSFLPTRLKNKPMAMMHFMWDAPKTFAVSFKVCTILVRYNKLFQILDFIIVTFVCNFKDLGICSAWVTMKCTLSLLTVFTLCHRRHAGGHKQKISPKLLLFVPPAWWPCLR